MIRNCLTGESVNVRDPYYAHWYGSESNRNADSIDEISFDGEPKYNKPHDPDSIVIEARTDNSLVRSRIHDSGKQNRPFFIGENSKISPK